LFLIILWVPFLRVWWWFFLPLMLVAQLRTLYLWFINWDFEVAKFRWVMLEIIPPREVLVPFKAMEDVLACIWPLYDGANFRERWCDGELNNGPYWCSFELASIEGKIHFYIRILKQHRIMFESVLYAHYPDIEIFEVPDYTKLVSQTVPNEEWDMYGEDYVFRGGPDQKGWDAYPLKTYEKFFEPQGERIQAEEKRMDPIISLLESMSKLGPGEHYWIQFITVPVTDKDEPNWRKEGQRIINKLARRPEKKEIAFMEDLMHTFEELIFGPQKEGEGYSWRPYDKNEETGEREMVLTPGEREIITEIENKMKKPVFRTSMRSVYVAKRENWTAPHKTLMRSYVSHFATRNMNILLWDDTTRPRVHYFMRGRRVFMRARKMFRMSVLRYSAKFPDRHNVCPILSTEELATMYHFPIRVTGMVTPTMEKIESKKAGPPPNLPVE